MKNFPRDLDAYAERLLRRWLPDAGGNHLARRIQRAAFGLAMLLVSVLGGAILLMQTLNLRANALSAQAVTLQAVSGDIGGQIAAIVDELHYLSQSPLVWTAISDSIGRDAYLRPYLRSRSAHSRTNSITLLDYRGRLIAGVEQPLDPASNAELRAAMHSARHSGKPASRISADGQRLFLAFPVLVPFSPSVVGMLLGEAELLRLAQGSVDSLGSGLGLAMRDAERELFVLPEAADSRYLSRSAALRVQQIDGLSGLRLELFARQPAWLWAVAQSLLLSLALAAALVGFTWVAARRLAETLTRRLHALAQSVARGGDPEALPSDDMDDEIGMLNRVLKDSLRANRDFTRTLEERVARRTSELAASEAKYRFLAESIQDVVWTLDTETLRFLYVSPSVQGLRGYTPAEILAAPLEAALMPSQAAALMAEIVVRKADFLSGAQPPERFFTHLIEQPRKHGGSVWTEAVTRFDLDPHSGHVILLGVTRDISERLRTEELQRYAAFQSGIAEMGVSVLHNIGNAITAVSTDAEALCKAGADLARVADLLDRAADAESAAPTGEQPGRADAQRRVTVQREAAAVIRGLYETGLRARGQRIADSVRHIADMVRMQQNAALPEAVYTRFDLGQALRDVLQMHAVDLQRDAIDVELRLDPDLPPLTLPRNALLQALMHIVGNARQAIQARGDRSRGGRLEIHAANLPDAQRVRISFKDNGIGFDPAHQASAFHPAADGLGLHATALFAQEIGGRVELHSPGLGRGACLVLELPFAPSGVKARIMGDSDEALLGADGVEMRTGSQS